jgi:hypothetical protein|tara:strand:- start:446 stop:865 length:420 start_codon:yes stop_codon:yes gene_type:complete
MRQSIKIILILFLGFIIPIIYLYFTNVYKVENKTMEIIPLVTFYSGRIGKKHQIKIKLIKRSNMLSGLLINSFNKRNKITGQIYGSEIINFTEFERGERKGSFLGKFKSNSEIIGLWSTPDGRLSSPFYLIQEYISNKI